MKSFFRHLKAAWYFGKRHRYVPVDETFFTPEDARALLGYFNSTSGLKLKQILTNICIELAVSATQTKSDTQRDACGYASGARGIISTIESYFPHVTANSDTTEDQQQDAADPSELFSA